MINKQLLKTRFTKSLISYNKNALVQDKIARDLVALLIQNCSNMFSKVLEIGTGTGLLTKYLAPAIKYNAYFANDVVAESEEFVRHYAPNANFIAGDIENVKIPRNFDLIASSSSLHWVSDFGFVVDKMNDSLIKGGIFAFTTFSNQNFCEIKDILGISLNYLSAEDIKTICGEKLQIIYFSQEILQMKFDNIRQLLKHIKLTGTNAVSDWKWTKTSLKEFEDAYEAKYRTPQGLRLTYNPVFVILKKLA